MTAPARCRMRVGLCSRTRFNHFLLVKQTCPALMSGRFFTLDIMKYFKKENIRSFIYGPDNKPVAFNLVAGETGIIALEDNDPVAAQLAEFAGKRMGGVVVISAEIYESLKKNEASTPSRRPSVLNQIRTSPSPTSFGQLKPAAAPAAVAKPGIRIMDEPRPPSSIAQFRQTMRSKPINPQ